MQVQSCSKTVINKFHHINFYLYCLYHSAVYISYIISTLLATGLV